MYFSSKPKPAISLIIFYKHIANPARILSVCAA